MKFNVTTRLGIKKCDCRHAKRNIIYIGSTAYFTFDLNNDFESIKQITFLIKQQNKSYSFETFKYDSSGTYVGWNDYADLGVHFDAGNSIAEIPTQVRMILDPAFTKTLTETAPGYPAKYEIAVEYEDITPSVKDDSQPIIIYPQPGIIIIDSLYNEQDTEPEYLYVSESTVCSDTLYCR